MDISLTSNDSTGVLTSAQYLVGCPNYVTGQKTV
jgi:hypothetical protein